MEKTNRITILGAGTMGAGIAAQFSQYGYNVTLYSRSQTTLDRARKTIDKVYELLVQTGKLNKAGAETAAACISYTTTLEDAVQDAWYVVETIVERVPDKTDLYQKLDELLEDDVVLTSNTSFLDIFALVPPRRRARTLIAHWYAPAHILPLVEIVKGADTLPDVVAQMLEFYRNCGKVPVLMERYVPGFNC